MDQKFDTVVAIDCWWNLPDVVAQKIVKIDCEEIIVNNTFEHNLHNLFKKFRLENNVNNFIKDCIIYKKKTGQAKKILLTGQAWDCGVHNETLGVINLVKFLGLIRLYVHTEYLALGTRYLNRTCKVSDIENFKPLHLKNFRYKWKWKLKENTFYECIKLT